MNLFLYFYHAPLSQKIKPDYFYVVFILQFIMDIFSYPCVILFYHYKCNV